MKVLLLGSGGREHALAWKIAQSPKVEKLYIAPGNAGTSQVGENVDIKATDFAALKVFALERAIDMIVVGPEDPLVQGIFDYFKNDITTQNIAIIGPSAKGAQLEGSKEFAKEFMKRYNIPTARYKSVTAETLNGAEDRSQTSDVEQLDQENFPCRKRNVVNAVVVDRGRRLTVVRTKEVINDAAVDKVACD